MKSNKGFSLVELIVVIAIMAIIAGVAIPVYSGYITKANEGADENLFGEVEHAAQIIVADVDYLGVTFNISAGSELLTVTATGEGADEAIAELVKVVPGLAEGETEGTYELDLKSSTYSDSATVKGVNVE